MAVEKLSGTDLNLLPVLQVLLEERNVTRAAGRLNLSQPAVSRNLSRLRELFNDPLFTRSPKGLEPTPRAYSLGLQLQHSLRDLEQLIEPPVFIPENANNTFKIATTDYGTQVLLPGVVKRVREEAPGINLEITPWHAHLLTEMDQQQVDLAICALIDPPAMIHGRGIGQDQFVCVLREDHPLVASGLTLESYAAQPHALITMGGERKGAIDHLLEKEGLKRRIALRVPHFVAALTLVASSDLILTVPYGLAKSYAEHYQLAILPFPMPQDRFTYSIVWHERHIKDPAHIWFRQLMYEVLTEKIEELQAGYEF